MSTPETPRSAWVVLTTESQLQGTSRWSKLDRLCRQHQIRADLHAHTNIAELIGDARQLAAQPEPHLAVWGSEALLGELVGGLLAPPAVAYPRLAFLGGDYPNDFGRMFGLGSWSQTVPMLSRSGWYGLDVGVATGNWGERHFINAVRVGLGAVYLRNRLKAGSSSTQRCSEAGNIRPDPTRLLRLIAQSRTPMQVSVCTSRGRKIDRTELAIGAVIANGQFVAEGWNVAPRASMQDGQLDMYVIGSKWWQRGRLNKALLAGEHGRQAEVHRFGIESGRIETETPLRCEIDGVVLGTTPLQFQVIRQAVGIKI